MLHGVNVAESSKYPPFLPWQTRDDVMALKALGFNSVRYLVTWEAVEPQPGQYDDAYLDRVAQRLAWCREAGLRVILDMHQDLYGRRYGGDGAPDWACLDDGIPFELIPGAWFMAYFSPAMMRLFDNFWTNQPGPGGVGIQDRFAAMWQHVASRFRDDPNVIGYDLLNEGWYGEYAAGLIPAIGEAAAQVLGPEIGLQILDLVNNPQNVNSIVAEVIQGLVAQEALFTVLDAAGGPLQEFERSRLQPFYDGLVAAIRAVDPNHICFFESASGSWSGTRTLTAIDVPKDGAGQPFANVVFAPHFYDFSTDFCFPYAGTQAYIQDFLARAQSAGDSMEVPTWFGEWGVWESPGVSGGPAERELLVEHHVGAFDALLCGWCFWQYGPEMTELPFLPLLARPYAPLIAGIPTRMETTDDTLVLEFAPDQRRGDTIIWVPPAYDAQVQVTFAGKGRAKIRRDGDGAIHVIVTPNADSCTITVWYDQQQTPSHHHRPRHGPVPWH
jgi:endoglycosylceramidase